MALAKYLRDAAVFAPCYLLLDWASYIHPLGPFNITPWNPQPALAIIWMMLAGIGNLPAVLATIVLADFLIRGVPGGIAVTLVTALMLAAGYAAMAWTLRAALRPVGLNTTRELTLFVVLTVLGTGIIGAAFLGTLAAAGVLGDTPMLAAWVHFWIGDAVGILVTAPLLLAAAEPARRAQLMALASEPEAIGQMVVLASAVWLIFDGLTGDPARHFYLLFIPIIWIAARSGMTGAVVATAIVQFGVVLGVHGERSLSIPVVELQALVAALTLTGLYLGVMVDQRERAEQSMRQTLRLAAAGEMAGAIAHEVNQPLTALVNFGRAARVLRERTTTGVAQLHEIIELMMAEAERAADIVRRLRDFFRAGTTRLEQLRVGEFLASARRIGLNAIGDRGITLTIGPAHESLSPLYVDRLQVELVIRNLLANAVDSLVLASREDGTIRIAVDRHDAAHLRIVVIDDGPGISETQRESLFEPFRSGKAAGMGLGLAVSRAIAEAHGGSLEAVAAGHGEFHLVLPCLQKT